MSTKYAAITTETHEISGQYYLDGTDYNLNFPLNGNTLQEMIDDALEFWNEAPESHGDFNISSEDNNDSETEIIIEGTVTNPAGDTTKTSTVEVTITAEKY